MTSGPGNSASRSATEPSRNRKGDWPERSVDLQPGGLLLLVRGELAGVPGFGERGLVGGLAGLDGPRMLQLGVELRAQQDRDIGDPQPDQEDDHAGERAVGLVV